MLQKMQHQWSYKKLLSAPSEFFNNDEKILLKFPPIRILMVIIKTKLNTLLKMIKLLNLKLKKIIDFE